MLVSHDIKMKFHLILLFAIECFAGGVFHNKHLNENNRQHHNRQQLDKEYKDLEQRLEQYMEEQEQLQQQQQQQQQQQRHQNKYQYQNQKLQQHQAHGKEIESFFYTQVTDSYKIIQTLPHDPKAYTQGFAFDPDNSNILYESTGMYGESQIRFYSDFPKMEDVQVIPLEDEHFGEGCTVFYQHERKQGKVEPIMVKKLVQITWKAQTGYIYQLEPSFELIKEFQYTTTNNEGWGITYNPNSHTLIVTDGTEYLHIWDANTLEEIERIKVQKYLSDENEPISVRHLNELEYDELTRTILANVYTTNDVVRIDPNTGVVINVYDFSELYVDRDPTADVLNGIAVRNQTEYWITGKYWPNMYRIEFN